MFITVLFSEHQGHQMDGWIKMVLRFNGTLVFCNNTKELEGIMLSGNKPENKG